MTEYTTRPTLRYLLGTILAGVVTLALSWWWYDWHLVEKMLTRLALPNGVIWSLLVLSVVISWGNGSRRQRILSTAMLLLYWGMFNTLTATSLIGLLENQNAPVQVANAEPFDALVVLGGGTSSDSSGNVWLNLAGERVILPVRFFYAGKVRQLITTGEVQSWSEGQATQLSVSTQAIWEQLGVPAESITRLGGKNTSQEMRQVRDLVEKQNAQRIGLVTSAFHLPRAQRLARTHGLDVIPVPAGYLGQVDEPLPLALLPSGNSAMVVEVAVKEFLASLVGR